MIDRSSPTHVLRGAIAELEAEFATALAACPQWVVFSRTTVGGAHPHRGIRSHTSLRR